MSAFVAVIIAALAISLLINPVTGKISTADEEQITLMVTHFGEQLRTVSLQDPKAEVAKTMQENYSDYVSRDLIEYWVENPGMAPGRQSSSPWPVRIDVISIKKLTKERYEVVGQIIEITGEMPVEGTAAATRPITLEVNKTGGRWLIDRGTLGPYDASVEMAVRNNEVQQGVVSGEYSIYDGSLIKFTDFPMDTPISRFILEVGDLLFEVEPSDFEKYGGGRRAEVEYHPADVNYFDVIESVDAEGQYIRSERQRPVYPIISITGDPHPAFD